MTENAVMSVEICDTTLRDGEQSPGVVFNPSQKIELAEKFLDFGIDIIELMPAISEKERQVARYLSGNGARESITASTMLRKEHIQLARDYGIGRVTLFTPVSDVHLRYKMGISREENFDRAAEMVSYAKEQGLRVNFAGEDSTRADMEYLVGFINGLGDAVECFLPCDTLGCLTPRATYDFIRKLKARCNVPIGLHIHNDFGLATASTLAGLDAGADMFSATFTGIGERAGNAPMEEVCMALKHLYGVDLGVDYEKLTPLCMLVQEYSGVKLQPHKPIVGENAFSHESGVHVDGVIKYPGTYENFPPESVGQERMLLFGKHSGRSGLRHMLGPEVPENEIAYMLERVKAVSESERRALSADDVREMYASEFSRSGRMVADYV